MKRKHLFRIGLIIGVLGAVWGALQFGIQFGRESGRADYHNTYVRYIQAESGELVRETRDAESSRSHFLALKLQALAVAAGDDERFYKVIDAVDFADIEESGVFVGTYCGPGSGPGLRLTVDISEDGQILVEGVEFSEQQITVLAEAVSLRQENAKLHIRASRNVSTEMIKKVVAAAGKGGMTKVIFGAWKETE